MHNPFLAYLGRVMQDACQQHNGLATTSATESHLNANHRQGHLFRMPNDRLPKKLLFGEVKGLRPPGRSRSSFNDDALRDCQNCQIGRPYRDAQDRLLWKDKTCPTHT